MKEQSFADWIQQIAEQYDVDLEKTPETEKQKKILESAIHVFAEKGYSGASTSEIAERAGVAEATIFKHYRTKKGLLLSLVIPAIARIASPMIVRPVLEILKQDLPLEQLLQEIVRERVQFIEAHWKKIKIIIVESIFHPELREAFQQHVAKQIFAIASENIDQLKKQGKVRQDLPNHVILRSIASMVMGYLFARNMAPEVLAPLSEEEEVAMIAKVLVQGLKPKERD
jgi:AcrR family transcriptional regulator